MPWPAREPRTAPNGRQRLRGHGGVQRIGHPGGEQGLALRPDPARRALERRLEPDHRGFSPRCRYAMPSVSGSKRTAPKPACSMSAAKAFGFGKLATEAGRYE